MYRYTKCEVCGKGFVIGATISLQQGDVHKETTENFGKRSVEDHNIELPKHPTRPKLSIRRPVATHENAQNVKQSHKIVAAVEERVRMKENSCRKEVRQRGLRNSVTLVVFLLAFVGCYLLWRSYANREEEKRIRLQAEAEENRIKVEAERKTEADRLRKAAEERAAQQRREREERDARIEKDRQERIRKELEESEVRRKEAEAEAAKDNYRRALVAFCTGATDFYSEAPEEHRVSASLSPHWYVNALFAEDKRIYEIKAGSTAMLYPDTLPKPCESSSLMASIESKPGLLAADGHVWICGADSGVKICDIPKKDMPIVPLDCELCGLRDVALSLNVPPPERRYKVSLRMNGGGKSLVVGVFGATEPVSRESVEKVVYDELNKRLRRIKRSARKSDVENYLATCKVSLVRIGKEVQGAEPIRQEHENAPKMSYTGFGNQLKELNNRLTENKKEIKRLRETNPYCFLNTISPPSNIRNTIMKMTSNKDRQYCVKAQKTYVRELFFCTNCDREYGESEGPCCNVSRKKSFHEWQKLHRAIQETKDINERIDAILKENQEIESKIKDLKKGF